MAIDFSFPPELEQLRHQVREFMDTVVRPIEKRAEDESCEQDQWLRATHAIAGAAPREGDQWVGAIMEMRGAAHEWGLWLPHMPKEWGGMGLGHVAMASVSAEAGK